MPPIYQNKQCTYSIMEIFMLNNNDSMFEFFQEYFQITGMPKGDRRKIPLESKIWHLSPQEF